MFHMMALKGVCKIFVPGFKGNKQNFDHTTRKNEDLDVALICIFSDPQQEIVFSQKYSLTD